MLLLRKKPLGIFKAQSSTAMPFNSKSRRSASRRPQALMSVLLPHRRRHRGRSRHVAGVPGRVSPKQVQSEALQRRGWGRFQALPLQRAMLCTRTIHLNLDLDDARVTA